MLQYQLFYWIQNNKLLLKIASPIKNFVKRRLEKQIRKHPLRRFNRLHKLYFGRELNLWPPKTLCEKFLWMEYATDVSQWRRLTDKVSVRDYIAGLGLEEYLPKVYHILDELPAFDDFVALLPRQCVVKTSHSGGSEGVRVISSKKDCNLAEVYNAMSKSMHDPYGERLGQPHYTGIKPRLIIEEFLSNAEGDFAAPLDDYKFMCINGSPVVINAIGERDIKNHTWLDQYYNLDMELLPWEKQQCGKTVRKPKRLKEMVNLANKLAKPFPFVRVDLYDTSRGIVFGELTFTPGFDFFIGTYGEKVLHMGESIDLSGQRQINDIPREYL